MNDVMHIVAKMWYRLNWGLILLFSVVAAAGSAATLWLPAFETTGKMYGLGYTTLILAGATIVYSLTAYWLVAKQNASTGTFVSGMIFAVMLLAGLSLGNHATGAWPFIAAWYFNVFFAGMYGPAMLLGSVMLTSVYISLDSHFDYSTLTMQTGAMLAGSAAISIVSYFFWKSKFNDSSVDKQLSQLSGQLKSNQEQSAIIIQSIADGVIVVNTEGKITLMNPAAATLTGWTVDDALNIDVQQVVKVNLENGAEIPKENNPFALVLSQKQRVTQVVQAVGRDNAKRTVSLAISPIALATGNVGGAVAVMRDISAQRAEEQQRAEFISTASHEMRTPVAAIEGYLALALNDKVSTIDSRARSFLEKAHASTQHLGQLFQDLLTSAKAEDGRLSNHPTAVEMGSFLEQLSEDLRFAAQKKGLTAEFIVGSNEAIDATSSEEEPEGKKVVKPLYYVYVDADRLQEVITNLFDNAVKYTDSGKVSIGLTGNNEVVQIYLRDTGNGIPAEDIPHLFQKFYRVDNSATRTIGGTGLGLFIARKIIELYQGRIWAESQLGKGSTFFINLPRLSTQRAQQIISAASAAPPAPAPASTTPQTPAPTA